jgi:hypothetical protein
MVADTRAGYVDVPRTQREVRSAPSLQAQRLLRAAFTIVPIVAGVDKFFDMLTQWGRYLSVTYATLSPFNVTATLYTVGFIEIAAGIVVAFAPRIGGWLVAGWLGLIILNLALLGGYWDIALRDFGLMLGAIALARLSARPRVVSRY